MNKSLSKKVETGGERQSSEANISAARRDDPPSETSSEAKKDQKWVCGTCGASADHPEPRHSRQAVDTGCRDYHDEPRPYSGQAVDELQKRLVTDAEVDEFIREYHEGKHPLSHELKASLKEMQPRLFAEIRDIINRGKPPSSEQAVDRQEWTTRYVHELMERIGADARIADAHNAALAAEHQRREQAERLFQQRDKEMRENLDAAVELETERNKLFKQLLSAQAAIGDAKEIIERYNDGDNRPAVESLSDIEAILWKPLMPQEQTGKP